MSEDYMSVCDFIASLPIKITASALYKAIERGDVTASKVGLRWFIPKAERAKFIPGGAA